MAESKTDPSKKPLPPIPHTSGSVDPMVAELASTTVGAPEAEAVTRAQQAKSYVAEDDPRADVEAAAKKAIEQAKADGTLEKAEEDNESNSSGGQVKLTEGKSVGVEV